MMINLYMQQLKREAADLERKIEILEVSQRSDREPRLLSPSHFFFFFLSN